MRFISLLILLLLPTLTLAAALPQEERVPGGIALVPLPTDSSDATQVWFGTHRVWVLQKKDGCRLALVGIPLSAKDHVDLRLISDGKETKLPIAISPKAYKEEHLTVSQEFVTPDTSQLARYKREADEQAAVYQAFHATTGSWPMFRLPVDGIINPTSFGAVRFFNNEPRAPHSGMDIGAPEGRNVWAPADGVVIRTGGYFFNGNTVLIDHGNGLVSMICHLSKIIAVQGQHVKAGDLIGLVGHTGRVTAPHVHWGVSLNDARVNPALVFPAGDAPAMPAASQQIQMPQQP